MWLLSAAAVAGCEPAMVERAVETVRSASARSRTELGAAAFGAACSDTALGRQVPELASVPPDLRRLVELKAAAEVPGLWMQVCGGSEGLRVLADMAALEPGAKRAHLWKKCALGDRGWMTEAEWLGGEGLVVFPWMAGAQLQTDGVSPSEVKLLVRALAGLD